MLLLTLIFGGGAVLLYLSTTIVITGQQTSVVIETFGKFSGARSAGLSFKAPWPFQLVRGEISLRVREIEENVTVKSVDNAFVTVPIKVQYLVDDTKVKEAFYKLDDPEQQIRSYIVNQVRSTASSLTFDNLFQSKNNFEKDVEETLKDKMTGFGYIIENVLVDDPQPSDDLRRAFDRVIASERLKEAATNEGEAKRIMEVAEANAQGQSLKIKGEAYAEFRKIVADGNGEALTKFCGDTGIKPEVALRFFSEINEMEAVRDASSNGGRVVFISGAAQASSQGGTMGLVAGLSDNDTRDAGDPASSNAADLS